MPVTMCGSPRQQWDLGCRRKAVSYKQEMCSESPSVPTCMGPNCNSGGKMQFSGVGVISQTTNIGQFISNTPEK